MQKLSESQLKYMQEAASSYRETLTGSEAEEYLVSRGLPESRAFGLGYVAEPLPGHEAYRGMLSIPYLRWSSWRGWITATIKFRRLDDGSPKYLVLPGDKPRLYNTHALTRYSKDMAITEGELDAMTATLAGVPAVGVPGVQMWKPHFRELFLGYRVVNVLADGDEAGESFARQLVERLPNGRVIQMPPGMDVNSLVLHEGSQALMERLG